MADFFQNGVISTLPKLTERPLDQIEDEIRRYTARQKAVLVLPALYSEFEREAMSRIVRQLEGADYLHRIILSLDRADRKKFERVREIMSVLPVEVKILWNDGPRIEAILQELREAGFSLAEQGKGRGVWLSLGYALTDPETQTIALHDCDILNYDRSLVARLIYPIVHPATDFEFSKGYYARFSTKLYGRVTRLFYTPLVRALQHLGLPQAEELLRYLDSFRYPLSGEFAMVRSLAKSVRISPTWGLEVSMLAEVFDATTVQRVCQVEVAERYDHKHQSLSQDDPGRGLNKMTSDIARTLFRVLAQGGATVSRSQFNTLLVSYTHQAKRAIEQYHALALLNGLSYDRHEEVATVEAFVQSLRRAHEGFTNDPFDAPLMAAWVRVHAALPELSAELSEAVELDNAGVAAGR
jgi:glucosyl-3-phosphoglycerate synthase